MHREIGRELASAGKELGMGCRSRGDSTLRGHYPLETEVLKETLESCTGEEIHGEVFCPFFSEGGRYTYGNVHYVKEGDWLVPAGMTEFAKDKTFGCKPRFKWNILRKKPRAHTKKRM